MKKIISITLALILALTVLASCGGTSDNSSGSSSTPRATPTPAPAGSQGDASVPGGSGGDTSGSNSGDNGSSGDDNSSGTDGSGGAGSDLSGGITGGGQAMASLIRWMMDGTYSYDFRMISEGPEGKTEGTGSWAQSGENFSIRQEVTVDGMKMKSWILQKDGIMYMIDEENQFIMKLQAGMDMTEGMVTDFTGIELIGAGTGEVDGKTLPYEDYKDTAMGSTVRFYLDGDDVYAFESEADGYKSLMIITNASGSVPSGAFDLPTGYMEF